MCCTNVESFSFLDSSKYIIYTVNLSDFDNQESNKLRESLVAFQHVVNHPKVELVCVLFNFLDVFSEKITKIDLKCCFPDYTGGLNFDTAIEYLKAKFKSKNINRTEVSYYQTCAIDDKSKAITSIISTIALEKHACQNVKIVTDPEYFKALYSKIGSSSNYDTSEAILELEIVLRSDANCKLFIDNTGVQLFIKAIKELKPYFKRQSIVHISLTKIYLKIAEKYQFSSEETELLETVGLKEKPKSTITNNGKHRKSHHKEVKKTHHKSHHKGDEKEKKSHHHKEEKKTHHKSHHKEDEKEKKSRHKSRHKEDEKEKKSTNLTLNIKKITQLQKKRKKIQLLPVLCI